MPSVRCSLDRDLGSLKPVLGLLSLSGWFSLGFLEGSLGALLVSQPESLKALLGSFGGLSLWSLEGLWSLEKLLLLVLVVVAVVSRVVPLPLEPSCGVKSTNEYLKKECTIRFWFWSSAKILGVNKVRLHKKQKLEQNFTESRKL